MDNGPFALLLLLACLVLLRLIRRPRANMRMAWEAASSETLAIAGPARSARAKRRRRGGALKPAWASLRAASGEKYPVINFDPSRRIDRSSMIVSSE